MEDFKPMQVQSEWSSDESHEEKPRLHRRPNLKAVVSYPAIHYAHYSVKLLAPTVLTACFRIYSEEQLSCDLTIYQLYAPSWGSQSNINPTAAKLKRKRKILAVFSKMKTKHMQMSFF